MIADAESILRVCGIDNYLQIGCDQTTLLFELLKRSINAYGLDQSPQVIAQNLERAPERFAQGSLMNYPFNERFGTIIIGSELLNYSGEDLLKAFKILHHATAHNLVLYFPAETLKQHASRGELMNRLFWEKLAIHSGFRRHPREMLVIPYHELEDERLGRLVFFQRIPDAANAQFSLKWLLDNRDLHMDMLREAGRRSDAHVSRYVLAATKVRPGDVVLDAACGLGYGTAVLAACSPGAKFIGVDLDPESVAYANVNFAAGNPAISFQASDACNLSLIADHSIDTVISFETIEHVENYDIFLAEVARVLKPDGRFIGSVPNLWCDETGKDPNPFHYHVFDWQKLKAAIEKYFIVDERWLQIAGGGFKLREGKRVMHSVPLDQPGEVQTEWWLISACANPLAMKKVSYTNPFHKDSAANAPVLINFEEHYDNPWLYRVMVQLGERLTDRRVLVDFCMKIISEARAGSADQGAALCVVCYQLLELGQLNYKEVATFVVLINSYDAAYDRNNPHAYRWALSLHYVAARLMLALGKRQEAMETFLLCAEMDPLKFSPLLATKTISARMYLGLLCYSSGDVDEAKKQLRLGIKEAHRVLQGNWQTLLGNIDDPLPFGLQEAAELLDIASQCSQTLHAIERKASVPGYIWDKINLKRFGLVEWNKSLERENFQLRQLQRV